MQETPPKIVNALDGEEICEYLCDSGTEFEGLKIWGSPWTAQFPGINPDCCAFTVPFDRYTEDNLMNKWDLIPHDVDILITHSPASCVLDYTIRHQHVGSKSLYNWLKYVERPRLHIFGHIHEDYGQVEHFPTYDNKMMISVNASHVNEHYEPVNKPIRIIFMTRCQHCNKLTHSEHVDVHYSIEDQEKIHELIDLENWTCKYMYNKNDERMNNPNEYGKLKCGDIYIHFIAKKKDE